MYNSSNSGGLSPEFDKEKLRMETIMYDGDNIQIIKPSAEIIYPPWDMFEAYSKLDYIARMCYKSHKTNHNYTDRVKLLNHLLDSKHDSIFEHHSVTFEITHNRAIINQITRHRLFSFTQESTRYCNYNKDDKIRFCTKHWDSDRIDYLEYSAETYNEMIKTGYKPEEARDYLPLSLASTIIVTGNLRQWRSFIDTRIHVTAQQEIRELTTEILYQLHEWYPIIFEDKLEKLNVDSVISETREDVINE